MGSIFSTAVPTGGQNTWSQTRTSFRSWKWVEKKCSCASTVAHGSHAVALRAAAPPYRPLALVGLPVKANDRRKQNTYRCHPSPPAPAPTAHLPRQSVQDGTIAETVRTPASRERNVEDFQRFLYLSCVRAGPAADGTSTERGRERQRRKEGRKL